MTSSARADSQESASAAHFAHLPACSKAAVRSERVVFPEIASRPIESNSSQFILSTITKRPSFKLNLFRLPKPAAAHPATIQVSPSTMRVRDAIVTGSCQSGSHFFSLLLRCSCAAQSVHHAKRPRLGKLRWHTQRSVSHLLDSFATLRPKSRRRKIHRHARRAIFRLRIERKFTRRSLQMFHHPISRNAKK